MKQRVRYRGRDLTTGIGHEVVTEMRRGKKMEQKDGGGEPGQKSMIIHRIQQTGP